MRVFTAEASLAHDQGADHPEQPERLRAVLAALARASVDAVPAAPATIEPLLRVHDRGYLARAEAMSRAGGGELGADTMLNAASWDATLGASGAALAALHYAQSGAGHSFAAIRPPGHHALHQRAMGFCIVNHAAVIAAEARAAGIDRVLIVDWDVHHGNGTQALVQDDPRTRFVSMHQWPWYPGSGGADERGVGNCFNIPMAASLPAAVYVESLWHGIDRALTQWTPELVIVSAGYDGMLGDPLGGFTLEPEDYVTWVNRLRERLPAVPIVGLMEGGYDPGRLADGVVATLKALG